MKNKNNPNSEEPSNEELNRVIHIAHGESIKEPDAVAFLKTRLASLTEENQRLKQQSYADDGFNPPEGPCSKCGAKQTVIRPGDIRCMVCENYNFLEKENQLLSAKVEKAEKNFLSFKFGKHDCYHIKYRHKCEYCNQNKQVDEALAELEK